jgi:uncharacterized protein (DUF488 family)
MNSATPPTRRLFTIGHSNMELQDFLGMLIRHEIKVVCDVRSRPGSFRFPQFNREALEARLISARIRYEFFGDHLGGRPLDPQYYLSDGLVDYFSRRRAPDFLEAVDRMLAISPPQNVPVSKTAQPNLAKQNMAPSNLLMMCAEEDPLHCHRFMLICPAVVQRGTIPVHLRRGGVPETQRDAEDRLLQLHGFADVTSDSLFSQGREAALEDALRLQSEQYAFRSSPEAIEYF